MKIAAIYDIHGNLPALEAVLADIEVEQIDQLIVGGDVVAGPLPVATLQRLQAVSTPTQFIRGNAESELLRFLAGKPINGLSARADKEAQWVGEKLPLEQRQFLQTWSATVQIEDVLFCHATPLSDITVFTQHTPMEKLLPIFANLTAKTVVCGHTHMQFDRMIGDVRVVNAGSVGMPFGKSGAFWLLLAENEIIFRRTMYDREVAAKRIRRSDYPDADDFATGNVLSVPTEDRALAMLQALEQRQNRSA